MLSFIIHPQTNIDILILIFGGLAIFLFGLSLTKASLKQMANKKLEHYIYHYTNTPLKSFIVGIITTILIQSSSGVTAIVVSFIAAGYLTFPQGLGIMIGANIGTCTTAFLFGINLENNALLIILIASILSFISTKNTHKKVSQVLLGIGFLFLGLQIMGFGFDEVSKSNSFIIIMENYANKNFPALIIGIILTFIIQSSSAVIGLLEQIYAADLISIEPAIILLLGSNIGTTLTGLISTIATNDDAKKAVIANIIFNILGTFLFIIILKPFANLLIYLQNKNFIRTKELMIANAHLIFNVMTVIIAYFAFNQLIRLTNALFKKPIINKKTIPFWG